MSLKQKLKFKSIRSSIVITFSILILIIIVVISLISYRATLNQTMDKTIDFQFNIIRQLNYQISSYLEYMKNTTDYVIRNQSIYKFLNNTHQDLNNQYETETRNQLSSIIKTRTDIANIVIISMDERCIFGKQSQKLNQYSNYKESYWYKEALRKKGNTVLTYSHVQNVIENEYKWVVTMSRAIMDYKTGKILGVMLVDLNYKTLEDMVRSIGYGKSGYVFIVDSDENLIYHPQQQLVNSNIKGDNIDELLKTDSFVYKSPDHPNKIYIIQDINGTNWHTVCVSYIDELIPNRKQIEAFYVISGLVFVAIAVGISIFLASMITRPIKSLENTMKKVENGTLNIANKDSSLEEISHLYHSFNIMITKIKSLIKQTVNDQKQKREIELKALQYQINPHFLYNTLDSIIWMAQCGKTEEVVDMTGALAKLFRTSISSATEITTIYKELNNLRNYLKIQKHRYGNNLNYSIECDEELNDCQIPSLLLQPLIENSIYHGIKSLENGGWIHITVSKFDDHILITIEDNGPGMTQGTITKILNDEQNVSRKIGVANVNKRISLYYGSEYGLQYDSEIGRGTTALVYIPMIKEEFNVEE